LEILEANWTIGRSALRGFNPVFCHLGKMRATVKISAQTSFVLLSNGHSDSEMKLKSKTKTKQRNQKQTKAKQKRIEATREPRGPVSEATREPQGPVLKGEACTLYAKRMMRLGTHEAQG
jgi:hypothetical protein